MNKVCAGIELIPEYRRGSGQPNVVCAFNAVKAAVDDEKHGAQRFSHDYDMTGVLNGGAGAARA